MANQKTYTIEISGVKESYENVSKLADVLDKLTNKVVKVSGEVENETKATRDNTKAKDELSKAQKKLLDYDVEYEKEVQRVKSALSQQKKEVSDLIKQEEAQSVVEAKQMNSYAEKQKYLTSLNKLIRTHANVTDEDKAQIAAMVQESAKLQAELKQFDEEMKIYTRNVGNYPGAAEMVIDSQKSLKQQIRETTQEMAQMLANGVSKTDEKFLALAEKAGKLKDAMTDASKEVSHFASDTQTIDNVINLAQTATSAWSLYSNAMRIIGDDNEEAAESMRKMMIVMSTLQSLQQLQTALTANGSASAKIYTTVTNTLVSALGLRASATEASNAAEAINTTETTANTTATGANTTATIANTTATQGAAGATTALNTANVGATTSTTALTAAQKIAAVASKSLAVAMKSIPIMALIGLVIALISHWKEIWNWLNKTFPVIGNISKAFKSLGGFINSVKATLKGFGDAVVNWVINPLQTLGKVMSALFKGDFEGAWTAMKDGLTKQFKGTADAFKNGFQKQVEKGLEHITEKNLKEGNKQTKQQLEELKIRERNNKTYSDKYIALQKKDFEERKKLAKGNADELNKIKLEELKFEADIEDKKTAYEKSQENQRTSSAKSASDERKKQMEEFYKAVEKVEGEATNLVRDNIKKRREAYEKYLKDDNERLKKGFEGKYGLTVEYENTLDAMLYANSIRNQRLIYDSLVEEAEETKKQYQKIIDEITNLIQKAEGETKVSLEKTKSEVEAAMEYMLGKYTEKAIKIPVTLDFEGIAKRLEKMLKDGNLSESLRNTVEDILSGGFNVDKLKGGVKFLEEIGVLKEEIKDAQKVDEEYAKELENIGYIFTGNAQKAKEFADAVKKYYENNKLNTADAEKNLSDLLLQGNVVLDELGEIGNSGKKEIQKLLKEIFGTTAKMVIEDSDKIISLTEKYVKTFQDATKGLKIEPVFEDDAFTKFFGGQSMNIKKTIEQYSKLKTAYEEYQTALLENQTKTDKAWESKLKATKELYGENSKEYIILVNQKKQADAAYVAEYEKCNQQISTIDKKTGSVQEEYFENLSNRIQNISNVISENVFSPMAEAFTALLDFQIEEAQKRLKDIEELLDKAVELREDSEQRIEEINDKLKDSDLSNTEYLKQQLADEQVLLVQRQQNERDLQKQKEQEEAIIAKKEKQQRKIELGQKLIEGIVNTAVGVTSALSWGWPLGMIFAAIVGAFGAMQTAIISKQMAKLEKGGKLEGPSHKNGGMRIEGTNIEVEGGEWVVNKKSSKKYGQLIEAINDDDPMLIKRQLGKLQNGTLKGNNTTIINNYNTPVSNGLNKYANGGRLNPTSVSAVEQNNSLSSVTNAIKKINFSPTVSVVDINKKSNNMTKVVDIAGGNVRR